MSKTRNTASQPIDGEQFLRTMAVTIEELRREATARVAQQEVTDFMRTVARECLRASRADRGL